MYNSRCLDKNVVFLRTEGYMEENTDKKNTKLVSIVIPCFNEQENIKKTFDNLLEIIRNSKYSFEIIAVDDGSLS